MTLDFRPWAAYLLDQLRRSIDLTGDERLLAIELFFPADDRTEKLLRAAA